MKRDMDLIRELLLKIERGASPVSWKELVPKGDDEEGKRILAHLGLLKDEDFIKAIEVPMQGFRLPINIEITWKGHDFLDAVRDPRIWEKTKKGAEAAGGFTVDLLKDLATGFVKKQIEEYTGVKL